MIFIVEKPTSERSEQCTERLFFKTKYKKDTQKVHTFAIMTGINHKSK